MLRRLAESHAHAPGAELHGPVLGRQRHDDLGAVPQGVGHRQAYLVAVVRRDGPDHQGRVVLQRRLRPVGRRVRPLVGRAEADAVLPAEGGEQRLPLRRVVLPVVRRRALAVAAEHRHLGQPGLRIGQHRDLQCLAGLLAPAVDHRADDFRVSCQHPRPVGACTHRHAIAADPEARHAGPVAAADLRAVKAQLRLAVALHKDAEPRCGGSGVVGRRCRPARRQRRAQAPGGEAHGDGLGRGAHGIPAEFCHAGEGRCCAPRVRQQRRISCQVRRPNRACRGAVRQHGLGPSGATHRQRVLRSLGHRRQRNRDLTAEVSVAGADGARRTVHAVHRHADASRLDPVCLVTPWPDPQIIVPVRHQIDGHAAGHAVSALDGLRPDVRAPLALVAGGRLRHQKVEALIRIVPAVHDVGAGSKRQALRAGRRRVELESPDQRERVIAQAPVHRIDGSHAVPPRLGCQNCAHRLPPRLVRMISRKPAAMSPPAHDKSGRPSPPASANAQCQGVSFSPLSL